MDNFEEKEKEEYEKLKELNEKLRLIEKEDKKTNENER